MAKKNFKDNPALQFISAPEREQEAESVTAPINKAPEGYKVNPLYIEKRTQRLQLILQPSLYNRLKEMSKKQNVSTNELIHQILDKATREENK